MVRYRERKSLLTTNEGEGAKSSGDGVVDFGGGEGVCYQVDFGQRAHVSQPVLLPCMTPVTFSSACIR